MDQRKIWSYFQTHASESFDGAATRMKHLADRLPIDALVLNVGVGSGQLERLARARGVRALSLDPDPASLAHARGVAAGEGSYVAGDLRTLPFADGTLDAVVVSEVLEHLDDELLHVALREIHRILRPGGTLWGTVPFAERLADSTVVCPGCGNVFHKVGHMQSFDVEAMRSLLSTRFARSRLYRMAFMHTSDLGWKRRAFAALRNRLVLAGVLTRDITLVFSAVKDAGGPAGEASHH